MGYMGLYKRVSRHVRFEPEVEKEIGVIIERPGKRQTFSAFVRNAVERAVRDEKEAGIVYPDTEKESGIEGPASPG